MKTENKKNGLHMSIY